MEESSPNIHLESNNGDLKIDTKTNSQVDDKEMNDRNITSEQQIVIDDSEGGGVISTNQSKDLKQ